MKTPALSALCRCFYRSLILLAIALFSGCMMPGAVEIYIEGGYKPQENLVEGTQTTAHGAEGSINPKISLIK